MTHFKVGMYVKYLGPNLEFKNSNWEVIEISDSTGASIKGRNLITNELQTLSWNLQINPDIFLVTNSMIDLKTKPKTRLKFL